MLLRLAAVDREIWDQLLGYTIDKHGVQWLKSMIATVEKTNYLLQKKCVTIKVAYENEVIVLTKYWKSILVWPKGLLYK